MGVLHRILVLPAALALMVAAVVAPAGASDFSHHGAPSWHRGGAHPSHHRAGSRPWHDHAAAWRGHHHGPSWHHGHAAIWHHRPHRHRHNHHRWNGLVRLPTLPILIEEGTPDHFSSARRFRRPPGVPNAVPYVRAGRHLADSEGRYAPDFYGGYGLPTWIPGSGTYAGNIEAARDPGNGTYFAFYGNGEAGFDRAVLLPSPKIIRVGPGKSNAACHMEAGVCVIRP